MSRRFLASAAFPALLLVSLLGVGIVACKADQFSLNGMEDCTNNEDDDENGLTDCEDPACAGHQRCSGPSIEVNCHNGLDDDNDGAMDCADDDCAGRCEGGDWEWDCSDQLDNDGDGLIDCIDPDCQEAEYCVEHCNDGVDNDKDGLTDCADPFCFTSEACRGREFCSNGEDDDGDGLIDCEDPDCAERTFCRGFVEICTNGVDDDGDGLADCADPDCEQAPECGGNFLETCNNGVDDDGDGDVDCDDLDCETLPICQLVEICFNGIDDDLDGVVDCDDPDCAGDPGCIPTFDCEPSTPVSCFDFVFGDTTGRANAFETYTCGQDPGSIYDAGEQYWIFTPSSSGSVTITFDPDDPDMALIVMPGANQGGCDIADACHRTIDDAGGKQVVFQATAGETYYFIIDGLYNSEGPYNFDVFCDQTVPVNEVCDDGVDNDGDGLADCFDDDCIGVPPCDTWQSAGTTCIDATTCMAGDICFFPQFPWWSGGEGYCTRPCTPGNPGSPTCTEFVSGSGTCSVVTLQSVCILECGNFGGGACPPGMQCLDPASGGTDPLIGVCLPN